MGLRTEFTFNARLKKETPKEVINNLLFMSGKKEKPKKYFFEGKSERFESLLYQGLLDEENVIFKDCDFNEWIFETHSEIKDQLGEIKDFIEFIKPWIKIGYLGNNAFAKSKFEEDNYTTYYVL